jgi:hypothetical protein
LPSNSNYASLLSLIDTGSALAQLSGQANVNINNDTTMNTTTTLSSRRRRYLLIKVLLLRIL